MAVPPRAGDAAFELDRGAATVDATGVLLVDHGPGIQVGLGAIGRGAGEGTPEAGEWVPGPGGAGAGSFTEQSSRAVTFFEVQDGGLEQWWVLDTEPPGRGDVVVRMPVSGASVEVGEDGASARLVGVAGDAWLVSGLAAWDASGRPLPARFEERAGELDVVVDADGASWPVTIDPLYRRWSTEIRGQGWTGFNAQGGGDVNGDGYDDVVVASPSADRDRGVVGVYLGSSSGVATTAASEVWGPEYSETEFGSSLAAVGDVNGDGFADVMASGPYYWYSKGYAALFLGSPTGLDPTPFATWIGANYYDYLGSGVGGLGDVNGDGFDDVAVGSDPATGYPQVDVWLSGGAAMAAAPSETIVSDASTTYVGLGRFGDVDGDGIEDYALTQYAWDEGQYHVEIYLGGGVGLLDRYEQTLEPDGVVWSVGDCGDVNGDGYCDHVATGWGTYAFAPLVFMGSAAGVGTGVSVPVDIPDGLDYAVSFERVGDVDGDGFEDVALVAPVADLLGGAALGLDAGYVAVYPGSAAGLETTPMNEWQAPPRSLFGASVDDAGDVNGDGVDDLIIGAPGYRYGSGAAFVYLGFSEDGDADGAGHVVDCDDADPAVHAGAEEVCDGIDNDCDGTVDVGATDATAWYPDVDADGWGRASPPRRACWAPAGYAARPGDCDDEVAGVHPGAEEEVADGVDADCDGVDLCYLDADGDGWRTAATTPTEDVGCVTPGHVLAAAPGGDCDDADPATHPGATDHLGDGLDQDCNGRDGAGP